MTIPELILIGGGGHCHACIDVIEQEGKFKIAGIVDIPQNVGLNIMGYPIIGTDEDLKSISEKYDHFFITIGSIRSIALRSKLYHQIKSLNKNLPTVVSPLAYVSKHARIGEGTIVMHQAIINANATVGENNIINSKVLIEHDAKIGRNNHISTSSVINGSAQVGDNCYVGSNSSINNGVKVTDGVILGSSSTVIKDLGTKGTFVGVPVRKIKP